MGLFGKKEVDRDALIAQGAAEAEAAAAAAENQQGNDIKTGNDKIDIELTKIYAQLESFGEIRKANAERFSRFSEQLGEIRGMVVDTNKAMSKVEVAATKAVDLVESVHPEKLMIEVRKEDGKVEALRANIESNEAIMKDLMAELKRMREQMNFYKGTEQVIQLNEEVKTELANIKKMEAIIERHSDKVETIFLEVSKKFASFDKIDSLIKDLQAATKKLEGDLDKIRVKVETKEDKKEFVTLVDKFNNFETHTTNLLKLLDERSKTLKDGLEQDFKKLKHKLERKLRTGEVNLDAPDEDPKPTGGTPPVEDSSGADVAGGDVAGGGFLSRIRRTIISKTLDGGEPKKAEPAGEKSAEKQEEADKPEEAKDDSEESDDTKL